jgi:hypothetical protein
VAGDSQKERHKGICRRICSKSSARNIGSERTVHRSDAIAAFFAATAGGMYDALAFTHETVDGRKTYLEWEGKAFGKDAGGTTILTRGETGLIASVRLYHRPFQIVQQFSAELAKRLKGKVDPGLLSDEVSQKAVGLPVLQPLQPEASNVSGRIMNRIRYHSAALRRSISTAPSLIRGISS